MELPALVDKARAGDVEAFTALVGRFQHLAFGYALGLVHDFALAEDVAQEAFVAAWASLPTLETPAAFPGWLRGIVGHCAHRVLRRRMLALAPLEDGAAAAAGDADPAASAERRERAATVLTAVDALPLALREVTLLHYVHERSHEQIATFLGLPATTVNNRLHAARAAQAELRQFFGQPFFIAEPYTKRPGTRVSRQDTVRACASILDGAWDHVPEAAFRFAGGMDEILGRTDG